MFALILRIPMESATDSDFLQKVADMRRIMHFTYHFYLHFFTHALNYTLQ